MSWFSKIVPDVIAGTFGIRTEDEMEHSILLEKGDFSIRKYYSHVELFEYVGLKWDEAIDDSFSSIYGYINGENSRKDSFEMTIPLLSSEFKNGWKVSVYLPGEIDDLPAPIRGSGLHLQEIGDSVFAVMRTTGNLTESLRKKMFKDVTTFAKDHELKTVGKPIFAQYDQPFALPAFKRNEIFLPITIDT